MPAKKPATDPDDARLLNFSEISDPVAKEAARREAYRALFTTALGRVVLHDLSIEAGIGAVEGPPTGIPGMRDYLAGGRDHAGKILELAGVDPLHALQALTSGNEGYLYDRPDSDAEPVL